jgi:hypothetical protein
VPRLQTQAAEQLHGEFRKALLNFKKGSWVLAVFEGSPTYDAYSWCPDCIPAANEMRSFSASYSGPVKLIQFKVGTKEEWEGEDQDPNPFRAKFPFVTDLPTVILFYGNVDVGRISAPRRQDLLYLCERTIAYEEQMKNHSWHPPVKPTEK